MENAVGRSAPTAFCLVFLATTIQQAGQAALPDLQIALLELVRLITSNLASWEGRLAFALSLPVARDSMNKKV